MEPCADCGVSNNEHFVACVQDAYSTLSDPVKKADWERERRYGPVSILAAAMQCNINVHPGLPTFRLAMFMHECLHECPWWDFAASQGRLHFFNERLANPRATLAHFSPHQ